MYSQSRNFKPVAYDQVLKADTEMNRVLSQTPEWMRDESVVLDDSWPWWVEWQRQVFMASHPLLLIAAGVYLTVTGILFAQGEHARDSRYVKRSTDLRRS